MNEEQVMNHRDTENTEKDYAAEVLREIVAVAADPNATIEDVTARLDYLHGAAQARGDEESSALLVDVWNGAVRLHEAAGHAINLTAAAREVASQLQAQRDKVLEMHGKLIEDLVTINTDNPQVEKLVDDIGESAREEAQENLAMEMYEGGAYISYCPACDIVQEALIPVSHEVAEQFHELLTQSPYDSYLPTSEALRQRLADFMAEFVRLAQAETEAAGEGESDE